MKTIIFGEVRIGVPLFVEICISDPVKTYWMLAGDENINLDSSPFKFPVKQQLLLVFPYLHSRLTN